MATVRDILDLLEGIAPLETQEEWDNAGLLAGDPAAQVTRVLVALDLTLEVVEEAERLGVAMAIEPVYWSPITPSSSAAARTCARTTRRVSCSRRSSARALP